MEPNGEGYNVKWKDHQGEVFVALHRLRSNAALSDVSIFCSRKTSTSDVGQLFSAHKIVLASCSVVFERLWTSSPQDRSNNVLVMTDVTGDMFRLVLDFMYNGEVYVKVEEVEEFMQVAQKLQIRGLLPESCPGEEASHEETEVVEVVRTTRATKRPSPQTSVNEAVPAKLPSRCSSSASVSFHNVTQPAPLVESNRPVIESSNVYYAGNVAIAKSVRNLPAKEQIPVPCENLDDEAEEVKTWYS